MAATETYSGEDRRARDRAEGIILRRRQQEPVPIDRRRSVQNNDAFDIAAALELVLDECPTRRSMLALLDTWLKEANNSAPEERDESYIRAVEHATQVMKTSPDVLTGIAILQRQREES